MFGEGKTPYTMLQKKHHNTKQMNEWMNKWILGRVSGIPAGGTITNLAKEREPGIKIIKRTPLSFNYY